MKKRKRSPEQQIKQLKHKLKMKDQELEAGHRSFKAANDKLSDYMLICQKLQEERPLPFVWVTSDGRRLQPKDMDEEHLRNTISFLQRTIVHRLGTTPYLDTLESRFQAMFEMLKEARNREIRV